MTGTVEAEIERLKWRIQVYKDDFLQEKERRFHIEDHQAELRTELSSLEDQTKGVDHAIDEEKRKLSTLKDEKKFMEISQKGCTEETRLLKAQIDTVERRIDDLLKENWKDQALTKPNVHTSGKTEVSSFTKSRELPGFTEEAGLLKMEKDTMEKRTDDLLKVKAQALIKQDVHTSVATETSRFTITREKWPCNECTYLNHSDIKSCELCGECRL